MTMIELMIAMAVLAIGLPATTLMVLIGMQTDSRNKTDSIATTLDQEIIENFSTFKQYPKPGFVVINDCALAAASAHEASLGAGAAPGGNGAVLYTAATAPTPTQVGDVDWTQPAPALATAAAQGYAMAYQTCSGELYEVRWNIMEINPNPNSRISMLTVSTRPQLAVLADATGVMRNRAVLYARPTTLRTLISN
jgi:Tfp pilus assembly protein PilV